MERLDIEERNERNRKRSKKYYYSHKKQRLEYLKKYRNKNRKRLRERYIKNKYFISKKRKEYRDAHKEEERRKKRAYYYKHRTRELKRMRIWQAKNRELYLKSKKDLYDKRLKSWEVVIPKKTNCQICGKEIIFNSGSRVNVICFDHKREISSLKISPSAWLMTHPFTDENYKLWKKFNLGMLCFSCNRALPTKNREDFVHKVNKYVFGKEMIC